MSAEWILGGSATAEVECELLCLAHAGGSSLAYRDWGAWAPSWLGVRPVELPGRGRRLTEAPLRRMRVLAGALASVIERREDGPYALFGHSMGALVAFEVTQLLRARGCRGPRHLFVSAMAPPQSGRGRAGALHTAPDEVLVERLRTYNGTPPEVLANDELLALVLPTIRADFEVLETYLPNLAPLDVPVTVFGGRDDPLVSPADLMGWRTVASMSGLRVFTGGHFYLADQGRAVVDAIASTLADARIGAGRR